MVAARGAREGLWLELVRRVHPPSRTLPRAPAAAASHATNEAGLTTPDKLEQAPALGHSSTLVGLQPTVIASRAPHLLLEQSVMRFKESWTCIARQFNPLAADQYAI